MVFTVYKTSYCVPSLVVQCLPAMYSVLSAYCIWQLCVCLHCIVKRTAEVEVSCACVSQ